MCTAPREFHRGNSLGFPLGILKSKISWENLGNAQWKHLFKIIFWWNRHLPGTLRNEAIIFNASTTTDLIFAANLNATQGSEEGARNTKGRRETDCWGREMCPWKVWRLKKGVMREKGRGCRIVEGRWSRALREEESRDANDCVKSP